MAWLNSLTIRSLIVAAVASLAGYIGIADSVLPERAADIIMELVQLGALAVAAYGRKRAQGPL